MNKISKILIEPSDQKNKIARLSIAAACRLFSVEENLAIVAVKKEHIQFVIEMINKDRL